ncbi:MAG: hypothetical protein RLZZ435_1118 [Cyanobacteriota bacterium]|jgi:tRNA 2-selenouridine synthase
MSWNILEIDQFLNCDRPLLDVRSPGEFAQGHIPGAINLPLFTNAERAEVGTCYKHRGRDAAVELGLALVGTKLLEFVQLAKTQAPQRRVRLHCWRGGMRSESMAFLLNTAGFEVSLLRGGYKRFRRWVRDTLTFFRPIVIVGGMTGTGKTEALQALALRGEQILDLEGIAHHRGSSYGHLNLPPQPTTEQFENTIAWQWFQFQADRPVWIEAESKQVGTCRIPAELFQQMEQAPILELQRSLGERIQALLDLYGTAATPDLLKATDRIRKRLGFEKTVQIKGSIEQGHLAKAIEGILRYYDRTYTYDLERRSVSRIALEVSGQCGERVAQQLQEKLSEFGLPT